MICKRPRVRAAQAFACAGFVLAQTNTPQAEEVAEKLDAGVILSEAKNLSWILV